MPGQKCPAAVVCVLTWMSANPSFAAPLVELLAKAADTAQQTATDVTQTVANAAITAVVRPFLSACPPHHACKTHQ